MKAVAELRPKLPSPVVVMGDFNATPWSMPFRDFLSESKLMNTRQGFGILPSWPCDMLALRIPIDHILVDEKLAASHLEITDDIGSDHYGVYAELMLR
jgi:endonuclease/exonuclease/phosphatase (EEP) superfamily protein YafD